MPVAVRPSAPADHGFLRIAACTPAVTPADPAANLEATWRQAVEADQAGAGLAVFPELGLSAYAIDDLLLQQALLEAVETAVQVLVIRSNDLQPVLVVGAPLRRGGRLYNCAVVIHRGRILGVVPKSYLPNYREFYEKRWFAPGRDTAGLEIEVAGETVPFGVDLVFAAADLPDFVLGVEICEDLWTPIPPSSLAALAGATVLANLSASNITIGKAESRRSLCASQSARCLSAYVYAAAGPGESTTDLAWDGHAMIYELGERLAESQRFAAAPSITCADVDLERLNLERLRTGSFGDAISGAGEPERRFRRIGFRLSLRREPSPLRRAVERFPFVPSDRARLDELCHEAYNIQVQGLAKRLSATKTEKVVIGVSGGLDSTHALVVAAKAFDQLGLPRQNILGFTLPGFATSEATLQNALALMAALNVTAETLDIRPAAKLMLGDLGHPFARGEAVYDVTFENVQAGLRADYLFRAANQRGAIVVGTGDLSELALGWCTYGVGDQMSHYNVNSGVAKTLIQFLIRWVVATEGFGPEAGRILTAVLGAEISPELVPAGADGKIQSTESLIGPYALHDFTLYYLTRYGLKPAKIAYLAEAAWADASAGDWPEGYPEGERRSYDGETIERWMQVFLKRFFTQQFKRTAMPNGPKVASGGALSPRGDWRAPSDGGAGVWRNGA